jgi:hypothetical protein
MSRIAPIIVVVPISFLLALSFFVLLSISKAQTKGLKAFGYVVAGILWLGVLVIFLGGVYKIAKGGYQAKYMMHKKMMMQNQKAANMPAAKENQALQAQKAKDAAHCQNKGVVFKAN